MSVNRPLNLSVIIPAYNEEHHLKACLDALAAQTHKPDEVIVVDNNSSDATPQVAASYPFVRVVSEKKQGIVHARNAGFNAAQGDILCRIDSDTIVPPDWTQKIYDYFTKHPGTQAVTGDCYFYDVKGSRFIKPVHHAFYYDMQRLISGTYVLWGSNMALRKSAWRAVRDVCNLEAEVFEDIDLTFHLHDHKLPIRRLKSLKAGVSMRRGDLGPIAAVRYLAPWPYTYWANKRYGQTLGISAILILALLVALPFSLLYWLVHLAKPLS